MRTTSKRDDGGRSASSVRWCSVLWRRSRKPAITLLALTVPFVGLWLTVLPESAFHRWLQLGLGAVAVIGAFISPRLPVLAVNITAVATAMAWFLGVTADPFLLTGFAMFRLAENRGRHRFPWWMFAGAFAAVCVCGIFGAEGIESRFRGMLLGTVVIAVAWALGVRTREVKDEAASQAQIQERLRLTRDVHDVLSHSLGLIGIQAGVAAHLDTLSTEELRALLRDIEVDARASLGELKDLLQRERAELDPDHGMFSSLSEALASIARATERAGVRIELDLAGGVDELPTDIRTTVLRIVQEGLSNVARHARATVAVVTVRIGAESVLTSISDDGRGARGILTFGHGLMGMRERAKLLGGSVEVVPDSAGFTVRAALPLQRAAQGRRP